MEFIVYRHVAPNGKCYVGMTRYTMERRAKGGSNYIRSHAFYNAIQKYGWDNFIHEVLESGLSFEEACEKERYYIKKFHSLTTENGYNLDDGGKANHTVSEETRRKLSEKRRGIKMPPRSEEARRRLSLALTGRKFTPEHCANISRAKSGPAYSGKNNSHPRKVRCVETGVVFDTIKEAGEFKGGSSKNIISCCRGRLKTSGGYHWEYVEEV